MKPDDDDAPVEDSAPEDQIADLRRRLKAAEARTAAEQAAREEQENLARTMARAARAEAAEGAALTRDLAELRSLLQAQQTEHATTKVETEHQHEEARKERAALQETVDVDVEKRIAPELKRRLAEARAAWDEDRKRERTRLAETSKHEAEQRLAAAEATWRETRDREMAGAVEARKEEEAQRLTAARTEWAQEHEAAMADRDSHWRERLDREITETRAAMEKTRARAEENSDDVAVSAGMRSMRDKLNDAARRRRLLGYRIAVVTLLLALAGAFAFRYPGQQDSLVASGGPDAAPPDRAASADRRAGPDKTGPARAGESTPRAMVKPLKRPRGASKREAVNIPVREQARSAARTKALEAELSAMRERLEAEEQRANAAEYDSAKAEAARKRAVAGAKRARRARNKTRSKAVTDLKTEVRTLRERLDAADAAANSGQAAE